MYIWHVLLGVAQFVVYCLVHWTVCSVLFGALVSVLVLVVLCCWTTHTCGLLHIDLPNVILFSLFAMETVILGFIFGWTMHTI